MYVLGTTEPPNERAPLALHGPLIAVTWDNYGHLFPGDETTDAGLQEAFLVDQIVRGRGGTFLMS